MNFPGASSLRTRLLLASTLVVPLFLGGTGWYLERSYERSLETGVEERLKLQVLTLMAEADFDDTLQMPSELLEARFNQVNSGLFGVIRQTDGDVLWRSPSSVAADLPNLNYHQVDTSAGEQGFDKDSGYYTSWYSVLWQTEAGVDVPLLFTTLESTALVNMQLSSLRSSLFLWLGGTTLALLTLQLMVLLWGLRPLRELASDIAKIEAGEAERLQGDYPSEVLPLTKNLNSLLTAERKRRERTRNTLADLAHSLKTPLAVIRSADAQDPQFTDLVIDQSDQMEKIVSYQLQRASSGAHNLLQLVSVLDTANRLKDTLAKVYAQKSLQITLSIPSACKFRGEERDFMELLGTLMDNAAKYGNSKIQVSASGTGEQLQITIDDDGPGVPEQLRDTILTRGARADTTKPGQGIGLAIANDIAVSYGANIAIAKSPLGGAQITVSFLQ
ncbi:MAG: ATP-binding protein [Halioglobus sp.]